MKKITASPENIDLVIDEEINKFKKLVAEELKKSLEFEVPEDTGDLKDSIEIIGPNREGDYLVIIKSNYARPVLNGTRPHWAPIEPLKNWALRQLGSKKAGYAVQRKIADEGTDPNPFLKRAVNDLKSKFR